MGEEDAPELRGRAAYLLDMAEDLRFAARHAGIDEVEPLGFDEVGVDEALHLGRHAEVYPDLMEACAGHGFLLGPVSR